MVGFRRCRARRRAAITLMSCSFAACLTTSSHVLSQLCPAHRASAESPAETSRPAAQAAPRALFFGIGANEIQRGCRITPFVFNQRPFAVHSLLINTLVYVLAGGEFLRCACGVAVENGSKFPFLCFCLVFPLYNLSAFGCVTHLDTILRPEQWLNASA